MSVIITDEKTVTVIEKNPQVIEVRAQGAGDGISDHGDLEGLLDDDHTQYLNISRGDSRYYTKTQIDEKAPKAQARVFPSFYEFSFDTALVVPDTNIVEVPLTRIPIEQGKRYLVQIDSIVQGASQNGIDIGINSDVSFNGFISSVGNNTSNSNIRSDIPFDNSPPLITNFGFHKNNGTDGFVKTQGFINNPVADGEVWVIAKSRTDVQSRVMTCTFSVTEV